MLYPVHGISCWGEYPVLVLAGGDRAGWGQGRGGAVGYPVLVVTGGMGQGRGTLSWFCWGTEWGRVEAGWGYSVLVLAGGMGDRVEQNEHIALLL